MTTALPDCELPFSILQDLEYITTHKEASIPNIPSGVVEIISSKCYGLLYELLYTEHLRSCCSDCSFQNEVFVYCTFMSFGRLFLQFLFDL